MRNELMAWGYLTMRVFLLAPNLSECLLSSSHRCGCVWVTFPNLFLCELRALRGEKVVCVLIGSSCLCEWSRPSQLAIGEHQDRQQTHCQHAHCEDDRRLDRTQTPGLSERLCKVRE